jgi:selenocysteine lyase/cysteine desulfurase
MCSAANAESPKQSDREGLLAQIRESVIGERTLIPTSFGDKPLVYADYTASGRSLGFIEDTLRKQVLPFYANTHTETSFTGAQSTAYREQARAIIRAAVNGSEDDQIIFCGSGATSAINKLVDILGLRSPANGADAPVVFVGPYEHHSNELPWRESCADVVTIPLAEDGGLDLKALEAALQRYAQRPLKIGSFSAASNVTGIKTDTEAVAQLLHAHGALSFWDYAAAAPYVAVDMNPVSHDEGGAADTSKDAVFLSPHKLIGGPGTPGVLIVKKRLMTNRVPAMPGGGTVLYVTPQDHTFIEDPQRREEGGTPAIVEAIRAGLVFKLQQDVGVDLIEQKEAQFRKRALAKWNANPNIEILGNQDKDSLSIFSLRIKCPTADAQRDLHYGFVVALLNDLFGIQARGGCSCAGPYGHKLLNMSMENSRAIEREIRSGHMILRPGWVRLNFNYFIDEATFDYLVKAVDLVAREGWRLLPFYEFDASSATWRFEGRGMRLSNSLAEIDFGAALPSTQSVTSSQLAEYFDAAERELSAARTRRLAARISSNLPASAEALRWFVLPHELDPTAESSASCLGPADEKGAA